MGKIERLFTRLPLLATVAAVLLVVSGPGLAAAPVHAAGFTIDCSLSIDNPHPSTHQPGTVNIVSHVTCNAPVDYIVMGVALKRNGAFVPPSGSCVKAGVTKLDCNTAEPCNSGALYGGQANSEVTFPPGGTVLKKTAVAYANEQRIYCQQLSSDDNLSNGASIQSPNKRYALVMQGGGNLVVYGPNGAIWSSCTNGWNGAVATMQGDGNLVVYSSGHMARFASGTYVSGSVLQMQDDGNLVIYAPGHVAVWTSFQHPGCI